jgi:hypothetical protein
MAEAAKRDGAGLDSEWERAWSNRYPPPVRARPAPVAAGATATHRGRLKHLLLATSVLGVTVSSIAIAGEDSTDPRLTAARGEGDAIRLGERNPDSGESTRETALVANAGSGGLVLRPSNTAKGGRAISATCDNDGLSDEDGCAVYVNKGTGAAATFRTQGTVPFAIRETNTGLVQHLNSDMVDGKHATDFLARSDASSFLGASAKAADADALDGQDSSAFLGVNAKAADSNTLDGKDSSEFLGTTAKAADSDTLDGQDAYGFTSVSGFVMATGSPGTVGITSTKTGTGAYTVDFPDGTFSPTNKSCSVIMPALTPFSGATARIVTLEETGCLFGGGGRFKVRTFDAAAAPTDAAFSFVVDARPMP